MAYAYDDIGYLNINDQDKKFLKFGIRKEKSRDKKIKKYCDTFYFQT